VAGRPDRPGGLPEDGDWRARSTRLSPGLWVEHGPAGTVFHVHPGELCEWFEYPFTAANLDCARDAALAALRDAYPDVEVIECQ
jgi:hypothetical protein